MNKDYLEYFTKKEFIDELRETAREENEDMDYDPDHSSPLQTACECIEELLQHIANLEAELRKQVSASKVIFDRDLWEYVKAKALNVESL
jgi:hypothetical protein